MTFIEQIKNEMQMLEKRAALLRELVASYDETALKEVAQVKTAGRVNPDAGSGRKPMKCKTCGNPGRSDKCRFCHPELAKKELDKQDERKRNTHNLKTKDEIASEIKQMRDQGASMEEAIQELGLSRYMVEKYW